VGGEPPQASVTLDRTFFYCQGVFVHCPSGEEIVLDVKLVEAGGIEPPSERFQAKASTCLSFDLDLTLTHSQGRIKSKPVPKKSRSARPEHAV